MVLLLARNGISCVHNEHHHAVIARLSFRQHSPTSSGSSELVPHRIATPRAHGQRACDGDALHLTSGQKSG